MITLKLYAHKKEDGKDGNGWGPIPAPHDRKKFLTSSSPFEASSRPVKLYFLLICPTIIIIFLMKPISLIKIYLKLQLNLSYQINSIFRKN